MSYSVSFPCNVCVLMNKCNDRHFIEGAVNGIHSVYPSSKGHLGAGEVELHCQNLQPINPEESGQ